MAWEIQGPTKETASASSVESRTTSSAGHMNGDGVVVVGAAVVVVVVVGAAVVVVDSMAVVVSAAAVVVSAAAVVVSAAAVVVSAAAVVVSAAAVVVSAAAVVVSAAAVVVSAAAVVVSAAAVVVVGAAVVSPTHVYMTASAETRVKGRMGEATALTTTVELASRSKSPRAWKPSSPVVRSIMTRSISAWWLIHTGTLALFWLPANQYRLTV